MDVEHRSVDTGDVSLHTVVAGPEAGEPVVLLHEFPEFWYGWRHQIPALADAGYRVVAPDQRGYNRSDKPERLEAYTVDALGADAVGLLDELGYDSAPLIGHDWGPVCSGRRCCATLTASTRGWSWTSHTRRSSRDFCRVNPDRC